ncbi:MAG: fructose-bisphosphatase class III, partial [Erysipelotrichia bacterium]|nr:fructose-bisphosphatase class III [Erysipelotrichia bacterium]
TYVISDIHGCKQEFDAMMEQISFSDYDELYIVGDLCDRGNFNMDMMHEIMHHENMHLIIGNHDEWFIRYAGMLIDAKKDPSSTSMSDDFLTWMHYNGGYKTAYEFMDLEFPDCYDIKLYLEKLSYYQELEVSGHHYLLVHAGVGACAKKDVPLCEVPRNDMVWTHIGIDDNPYSDRTMVVGHVPSFLYGKVYDGRILHGSKADIMHIDCGCVYGRALGCVRLNDGKEFYVPSTYPYVQIR